MHAPSPHLAGPEAPDQMPEERSAFEEEHAGRYVHLRDWPSSHLPSKRDLFIYLPKAYSAQPQQSFPVLLLHDGQNLFDPELSFVKGSTWRAAETADEEIAAGRVEPLILVGIGNAGPERIQEYTHTRDPKLGGGKGAQYARLLLEELLPWLHKQYRIASGPANLGLAGSSLGGLITLALGLRYPAVFGKLGVLSPSIWWDKRAILDDVRGLAGPLPLRIWIDMGTAEGLKHVRDADLLVRLLSAKGWRAEVDLRYRRVPQAVHTEAAWADRFAQVLQFLFPATPS